MRRNFNLIWTKAKRLEEFYRRLQSSPYAESFEQAKSQIEELLNEVEDEFSGVPFNPSQWATDGRMYPPLEDNRRTVKEHPNVIRYRTLFHNVFIGVNGAIEIQDTKKVVQFSKKGADGRGIWDLS